VKKICDIYESASDQHSELTEGARTFINNIAEAVKKCVDEGDTAKFEEAWKKKTQKKEFYHTKFKKECCTGFGDVCGMSATDENVNLNQ
jgi:hypothetical protein